MKTYDAVLDKNLGIITIRETYHSVAGAEVVDIISMSYDEIYKLHQLLGVLLSETGITEESLAQARLNAAMAKLDLAQESLDKASIEASVAQLDLEGIKQKAAQEA